jgi:hypothetical protein
MNRERVPEDAKQLLRRQPAFSDEAVVSALGTRYQVSPQAMEFRLAKLGLKALTTIIPT